MNARSYFAPLTRIFDVPHVEVARDCRGATREIKFKTGYNKGKVYPYASVRQYARQTRRAAYGRS